MYFSRPRARPSHSISLILSLQLHNHHPIPNPNPKNTQSSTKSNDSFTKPTPNHLLFKIQASISEVFKVFKANPKSLKVNPFLFLLHKKPHLSLYIFGIPHSPLHIYTKTSILLHIHSQKPFKSENFNPNPLVSKTHGSAS